MARRNIRLQDFQIAESDPGSSRITCACIGRKSHQVAATGNDNKNVCLWKVSKPQALGVLKGHTSDVLTITFSNAEDYVYSGADGGTVFGWDLNQFKIAFSLKGHLTGCRCLAPSNSMQPMYLVTGSTDTNVKIWDLRRRQCVQTFKGHRAPITSVMFSPDGRWVASGSEDGTTRIWDLQTSKKLAEFSLGEGLVSVVKFNPQNLSLATGHADRTVKFWDLENFAHVSTTSPDSAGVSSLCFEPTEGVYLFSAASESLRCWEIESATMLDNIESAWKGVMDIDISTKNELLIGLAAYGSSFSAWTVDLTTVNFDTPAIEQPQPVVDRKPPARKPTMPVKPAPVETPQLLPSRSVEFSSSFIPMDTRQPMGLNPADFLSSDLNAREPSPPVRHHSPSITAVNDLQKIQSGHRYFIDTVNERVSALKTCADYIRRGNIPYAVREITRGTDFAVAMGVLRVFLLEDQTDLTIDACTNYLSLAHWLLDSGSDAAVRTAGESALVSIKRFGEFMISTLTAPETIGVDLSKEERR